MLSICFSADEHIFEISLGCSTYEKESIHVKKELQQIYKGQVKDYCKSKKIKMISCHLYSPKAQGKAGRSHCSLRQKIYYDLIQQEKKKRQLG